MKFSTDQKFSVLCRIPKLALFLLLALTSSFVNADEPADDRPIIMCPALPPHTGFLPSDTGGRQRFYEDAVIFREIGRQLVLNVFREEFGLPTRDESLFETIDPTSDHLFEVDVIAIANESFELTVHHKGKQVFSQKLNKFFAAGTGHRCATIIEAKFKPNLIIAIEKLGYKKVEPKKTATREYVPLPDSIEKNLRSMNHLKQYAALRELHRLMREEGTSTARLCGLVRGYATLNQLTFSTLDSRGEAFAARTMLYERRMRLFSGHSAQAISTEAYADTMLGYPNRAWGHHQKATKRFASENTKPDDWLPLIADYIHYRDSKIEQVMQDEDSSLREIAALLRFRSGLQSMTHRTDYSKLHAGKLALEVLPTCQWIYDRLAFNSGVAPGHQWNAAKPLAISKQLQDFLPSYDKLPQDIKTDVNKIIADGGFDLLSAANVANKLVAAGEHDKSEPSLAVLGRNIEAWNVIHVARSAQFYRAMIGIDPQPILDEYEPIFKNHPSAGLVRAVSVRAETFRTLQEYLDKCNELIKDVQYKHPNNMSDSLFLFNLHIDAKFGNDITARQARSISHSANRAVEHSVCATAKFHIETAYWMKTISRRSPTRMATVFREDWENSKQDFEQWVKDYPDSPAMLLTAAEIYARELNDPEKSTKFYKEYLDRSPDATIIFDLAKVQFHQSKNDDWIETLIRVFETEDQGLQHSNAAARLAATLMREGEFDLATEWAERANQSGSLTGMQIYQQCLTGIGKLDEASEMGRQMYSRYPSLQASFDWFIWCGANQHQDLDEAWELLEANYKKYRAEKVAEPLILRNRIFYHLYKGEIDQALDGLTESIKEHRNFYDGIRFAIYSDKLNKKKGRDNILKHLINSKKTPKLYVGIAEVFQQYFKTGKLDQAKYQQQFKDFPQPPHVREEMDYLLMIATLKHEGNKALPDAKNYLTKKSLEASPASVQIDVSRHLLLLELGEEPTYITLGCKNNAWTRITPNEVILKNRARAKKLREERAKNARRNDYEAEIRKRKLEKAEEKRKAAEEKGEAAEEKKTE